MATNHRKFQVARLARLAGTVIYAVYVIPCAESRHRSRLTPASEGVPPARASRVDVPGPHRSASVTPSPRSLRANPRLWTKEEAHHLTNHIQKYMNAGLGVHFSATSNSRQQRTGNRNFIPSGVEPGIGHQVPIA